MQDASELLKSPLKSRRRDTTAAALLMIMINGQIFLLMMMMLMVVCLVYQDARSEKRPPVISIEFNDIECCYDNDDDNGDDFVDDEDANGVDDVEFRMMGVSC